jgi:hypothetical protein
VQKKKLRGRCLIRADFDSSLKHCAVTGRFDELRQSPFLWSTPERKPDIAAFVGVGAGWW